MVYDKKLVGTWSELYTVIKARIYTYMEKNENIYITLKGETKYIINVILTSGGTYQTLRNNYENLLCAKYKDQTAKRNL